MITDFSEVFQFLAFRSTLWKLVSLLDFHVDARFHLSDTGVCPYSKHVSLNSDVFRSDLILQRLDEKGTIDYKRAKNISLIATYLITIIILGVYIGEIINDILTSKKNKHPNAFTPLIIAIFYTITFVFILITTVWVYVFINQNYNDMYQRAKIKLLAVLIIFMGSYLIRMIFDFIQSDNNLLL